jgi:hypothetical protein
MILQKMAGQPKPIPESHLRPLSGEGEKGGENYIRKISRHRRKMKGGLNARTKSRFFLQRNRRKSGRRSWRPHRAASSIVLPACPSGEKECFPLIGPMTRKDIKGATGPPLWELHLCNRHPVKKDAFQSPPGRPKSYF